MTIFDLLHRKYKYNPLDPAISWQEGQRAHNLDNAELWEAVKRAISFFQEHGLQKGDNVGIFANTSGYWHIADLAIMALGATTIPLYPTSSSNEINYIAQDTQMKFMLVEDASARIKIENLQLNLKLFSFKESNHQAYFPKYTEYSPLSDEAAFSLMQNCEENPASIIYTSGTTSNPKGVVTTHAAITEVLIGIAKQMKGKVSKGNTSLTCLPLSHVLGRCDSFLHLCLPIHTFFGESPKTFMSDLRKAQPSYIITVPRIIEKIRERIEASVRNRGPLFRKLYAVNYAISENYYEKIDYAKTPSKLEAQLYLKAQKHYFSLLRDQLSPNLKFLVSGGAKLSEDTYRFFRIIGIPILEGYGLTETFGPAFINSKFYSKPGHVGFPLPGIKINLAADGEILLKGASVFSNYHGLGAKDSEVFTKEGYFKTGDIGEWSISEGLKITDRKKDIIVTSGGKNIAPAKIESLMNSCDHISHFMLVGDGRKYLTGLISIEKDRFSQLIDSGLLPPIIDHEQLSQSQAVVELIQAEVDQVNSQLASYEKVKRFYIIPTPITADSLYLSASLKLKKDKLFNKYLKEIDAMY